MVAAFVAGVDRTIPFHLLGDIPVPGAPWRRPTDGEIEQAVGAARRCRFRGLAVQKFLVLSPQICAGCLPRRIGPGYHAGWVGVTHLRRHHEQYHLGRGGHLYQARFKSFPVAEDESFLTLCRYVEANVLRAKAHPRPRCVPTLSRTPYPQSRPATNIHAITLPVRDDFACRAKVDLPQLQVFQTLILEDNRMRLGRQV